jgi:uroporphyrinogen-III decarboxylase
MPAAHTQLARRLSWGAPISYEVFPRLAGITLRAFHLDASACARAFREGGLKLRDLFGADIAIPTCYCPPIAYGHLACLGSEVIFPENGAPAVKPILASVDEGIRLLNRDVVFERNDLYRKYVELRSRLQKEFPQERVSFSGFGKEGPITSAVLLRGQDFFMDLYDHPEQTKIFLKLLTQSVIQFQQFCWTLNQRPAMSPTGAGLCDDFAALVSPGLWPEFVLPYWHQYYAGLTTGPRSLHCEDLTPHHLPHLKELDLVSFDPDRSAKLTPKIISAQLGVPFGWSLQSFDYPAMSSEAIEKWVKAAFADGASSVYSYIYVNMLEKDIPAKVKTFIRTAKESVQNHPVN